MNDDQVLPPASADTSASADKSAKKTEAPVEKVAFEPGPIAALLIENGLQVEPISPDAHGVETIRVERDLLLQVGYFLRDDERCQFDFLVSVTGLDWQTHRESVYHLEKLATAERLAIKVNADANERSPSLYPVWPAVDWHEREAYDLLGIIYEGHPDLRRILMPNYWVGYPLRKDYQENDPRLVWNKR